MEKKLKGTKVEVVNDDGTVSYKYIYKKNRKRGRPKKRGPKKKYYKKVKGPKKYKRWDFKIIRCEFKKQDKYIGIYHDAEEVNRKKNELLEANKKVILPVKYCNNKHKSTTQYEYEGEYVVLKRIRDFETQSNESQLQNEFGKFVPHVVTSDNWFIYDKFPYRKEETFWVFGFNPVTERKTAQWIGDNLIEPYISNVFDILQIYLYNNKLVFRYPVDEVEIVVTKNVSDGIRLYNYLEERFKKNKRNILFMGYAKGMTDKGGEIIQLIRDKTNWSNDKIYRKRTY